VDTSPEGVVPTQAWENIREGVDDARYVRTLERAIARARQSGSARAAAVADRAQKTLDWILDRTHPTLSYYTAEVGFWDASVYDALRRRLARAIVQLKEATP